MIDLYLIYGGMLLLTFMQIAAFWEINKLWRDKKNVRGTKSKICKFRFFRYGNECKTGKQKTNKTSNKVRS